jgi:serine phosphatase RsbU (regulator of sigma subunit)
MEEAARKYARRVLIIHVLLLAAVLVLVYVATREVYQRTREQVMAQAQARQELLTAQTAQAIHDHYGSILANLQLIKRVEETERGDDPAGPQRAAERARRLPAMRMAAVLWTQLEGRVDQLIVVRRQDMRAVFALPQGSLPRAQAAVDPARQWLAEVRAPAVSRFIELQAGGANLVAVPFLDDLLIVAVVPIGVIESRFLDVVNRQDTMSATLLDSAGHTMATSDRRLVGGNVFEQLRDGPTLELFNRYMAEPRPTTVAIEQPLDMGQTTLPPRMITATPIRVRGPGGEGDAPTDTSRPWTLLVASHLSDVDTIVRASFGRALIWAVVVGLILTALLVSTAVQMIRARVRLENLRNEALRRELDQARKIQLAWLPSRSRDAGPVRIAAINQAANHISGDFYDWFDLPDGRTVVTIGDVTGHGMSAAFLMATTQLLVRNTMPRLADPGACLTEVNRQLCQQVFSGQFVTMLIVVIDLQRGQIEAATAGHFPPLVCAGNGFYPLRLEPQLVLGIDAEQVFPTERFALPDGACILLYTDGVPDAVNTAGERFGADSILSALAADPPTPQGCIDALIESITRFRQERDIVDDLTIVAVRVQPSAATLAAPAPEAAGV